MAKILFFGDSITAFRENVIVASDLFVERFPQHEIVNRGVRGNDTGLARERFQQDVVAEQPDVLIFSFGCNDAAIDVYKSKTVPRIPLEAYLDNLKFFIREMRVIRTEMIFFTPPPLVLVEGLKPYYYGEPYISHGFNFMLDQYIAAARRLMEKENVPVADVNRAFRENTGNVEEKLVTLLPDGMHPNSAGQAIIFNLLYQIFESLPLARAEK